MEEFDLFDSNRNSIGVKLPRGAKIPEGCFRQVIHLAIFNSRGEMLIQKRTDTKEIYPGLWDISLGGGVIAGENPAQAVSRELFEELGIKRDFSGIRPHITISYNRGFDDFFIMREDIPLADLDLQSDEVSEARWATEEEVRKLYAENKFVPFCGSFISLLFYYGSGYDDVLRH